ncbi:MAG: aminoacyl-tRNA hydrolase, partial [Planctomycetes bacterium]|nr:aminoacyl-tRNA hydrolase [Planctomycetota bacterium]
RFLKKYRTRLTTEGELLLSSDRFRDQPRNVADCLEKLRELIAAVAKPPAKRRPSKPTKASKLRRVSDKRLQSARKKLRQKPGGEG